MASAISRSLASLRMTCAVRMMSLTLSCSSIMTCSPLKLLLSTRFLKLRVTIDVFVSYFSMVRCGQLVVGPAGSGKSTYCNAMKELCADQHRRAYLVNLDPAAEDLPYECDVGIEQCFRMN